jgi:hypothetical protein
LLIFLTILWPCFTPKQAFLDYIKLFFLQSMGSQNFNFKCFYLIILLHWTKKHFKKGFSSGYQSCSCKPISTLFASDTVKGIKSFLTKPTILCQQCTESKIIFLTHFYLLLLIKKQLYLDLINNSFSTLAWEVKK